MIRWRFVIHGGIDGYSRCIVFLGCSGNNRAHTVLSHFVVATEKYGLPSRVRSDYGTENYGIAHFMLAQRGINRASMITGSSVHNQRIERLWGEVNRLVCSTFKSIFFHMEDTHILDPIREVDVLFALHSIFIPRINKALEELTTSWNNHPLRTEINRSPLQLWHAGLTSVINSNTSAVKGVFNDYSIFGIDDQGFADDNDSEYNVSVPVYGLWYQSLHQNGNIYRSIFVKY
jgi:hypothetical protein